MCIKLSFLSVSKQPHKSFALGHVGCSQKQEKAFNLSSITKRYFFLSQFPGARTSLRFKLYSFNIRLTPVTLRIITLVEKTNHMIISQKPLYVNINEIINNISWGNLRSVEWQNNSIHIVFISNFATTEMTYTIVASTSVRSRLELIFAFSLI